MKKLTLILSITLTLSAFGQVPNYVPTDGLVGWWPFNGNANDESGNGNNGIVNGATLTTDSFGNPNSAYNFDGVNDRIEIIPIDFPQRTVSLWFYDGGSAINSRIFACDYPNLQHGGTTICIRNESVASFLGNGQPNNTIECTEPIQQNDWYNVVVVKTENGAETFINGTSICLFPSENLSSTANPVPEITNIGCSRLWDRFFKGKIDDIGIWNRALTPQEVADLYNGCQQTIADQPQSQTVNFSDNVQFTASSSDPNATYQWQTNLGLGFHNLTDAGQYSGSATNTLSISNVTLSNNNQQFRCIINSGSCSDTSEVAVLTVDDNVGLSDVEQDDLFSVYPNPAHSQVTIAVVPQLIHSNYVIYDNMGRTVLSGKINSESTLIDLESLNGGVYLLQIGESLKQSIRVVKAE